MNGGGRRGWRVNTDEKVILPPLPVGRDESPCLIIPFPVPATPSASAAPVDGNAPRCEVISFARFVNRRRRRYWRR